MSCPADSSFLNVHVPRIFLIAGVPSWKSGGNHHSEKFSKPSLFSEVVVWILRSLEPISKTGKFGEGGCSPGSA